MTIFKDLITKKLLWVQNYNNMQNEIKWNANLMQIGNFIDVFLAKNTSIELPSCIKLAFHFISWGRCTVKQPSNMQNVTLVKFALHKGLTYFKKCIFKFFHKFLNIVTVRSKYSVNTLSPHYLGNSYYNLKKDKNVTES